jgi:hypothetical protein
MRSHHLPVTCDGRLVAIAGPRRCHVLARDLNASELALVQVSCLLAQEVLAGRIGAEFTGAKLEALARGLLPRAEPAS